MSIEAIAALLGHRSLDMTMRYAKISNKIVAEEYASVAEQVEALYNRDEPVDDVEVGPAMQRLQHEVHHRLLGNGWCQRPAQLGCSYESICETCTHFATDTTTQPVLLRQRDHAAANNQPDRAELFTKLLDQTRTNE
jgi:hypothetical protein